MPTSFVVLDTNVVLDWLVFRNEPCKALLESVCLDPSSCEWIATQAMADELAAVLAYPAIQRWEPDVEAVWRHWKQWARMVEPPTLSPVRCQDKDDQKFIDLALAHQARWLLTRDRALLKLAKRARAWRVEVVSPDRLLAGQAGSEAPGVGSLAATAAETSLR